MGSDDGRGRGDGEGRIISVRRRRRRVHLGVGLCCSFNGADGVHRLIRLANPGWRLGASWRRTAVARVDVEVSGDDLGSRVETRGETCVRRLRVLDRGDRRGGGGRRFGAEKREAAEVGHRAPFEQLLLQPGKGDRLGEEVVAARCEGRHSIHLERGSG